MILELILHPTEASIDPDARLHVLLSLPLRVVSGSRDATLRVWDIETGQCLHVLMGHVAAVRCVQYDGRRVVSGAYDFMVKVWDPETETCLHTLQGHTNRVYSLQVSATTGQYHHCRFALCIVSSSQSSQSTAQKVSLSIVDSAHDWCSLTKFSGFNVSVSTRVQVSHCQLFRFIHKWLLVLSCCFLYHCKHTKKTFKLKKRRKRN